MRDELARGTPPDRIGFVSFTVKAVQEAISRAAAAFNLTEKDLPYFCTLHALGYRSLNLRPGDIMDTADWKEFGKIVGLDITGNSKQEANEGTILPYSVGGDKYVALAERAKLRCVSIEREFSDTADWSLSWPMAMRVDHSLKLYKSAYNKFTFVDMIDLFVLRDLAPSLDLLIVDEGQDLSPLQWRMVDRLSEKAKRVIIAGDDDQCIHRWAGVDVRIFMQCAKEREVLSQSYRLTPEVFDISQKIVKRIGTRFEKPFFPTDRQGTVSRVLGPRFLDVSEGSITIMARTNAFVNDWARRLREDGYMFSISGTSSVPQGTAKAIYHLRRLASGASLQLREVRELYAELPKRGDAAALSRGAAKLLEALTPDETYDRSYLQKHCGLLSPAEEDPFRTLRLGENMADYLRSLERRGENLLGTPRIKLSTIHAMKGGEDDIVAVDLSSTKACVRSPYPDDEHRTFYVGTSRARRVLHLIHTEREFRYVI